MALKQFDEIRSKTKRKSSANCTFPLQLRTTVLSNNNLEQKKTKTRKWTAENKLLSLKETKIKINTKIIIYLH